jgi:hypothetical protein
MTYGNSDPIIAYYDINQGNTFNFNCGVKANGVLLTSDERMKENINPLNSSLSLLQQLNGVSYHLKNTNVDSKMKEIQTLSTDLTDDLTEKERRDKAFFENWEKEQANNKELKIGFLAQELRTVFPELVKEDHEGILSIDYIGLIPVIVESIKEQQEIIHAQSGKIKELETAINNLTGSASLRSGADDASETGLTAISSGELTNAFLYQNTPNPFQVKTEIRYFLPEEVKTATIYIFTMEGSLIKKLDAGRSGSVDIKGADLSAGMYLYTLIADGKEVDTKRMILTK